MFWTEDLTEEGMIKFVKPRPRDTNEGEFDREKGDCDLHMLGEGEGVKGEIVESNLE